MDVLYHAFLPGSSLVIVSYGWWFLGMSKMVTTVKSEDYVTFSRLRGIPKKRIFFSYIIRNCLLPQVTGLAIQIGSIFSGAMATEVIFGYPGIGTLLYRGVREGDYNLMLGITSFSIIGVATAVFLLDMLYPLIDPRIRHK